MIETKQIGTLTQLTATQGYIHPLGTDTYVKQITILPTDTIDNYEEVDTPPPYTKAQYDTKVNDLIRRRYTASEEYAIHRKMLNTLLTPSPLSDTTDAETATDEYLRYNAYVEECKAQAPRELAKDNSELEMDEFDNTDFNNIEDDVAE